MKFKRLTSVLAAAIMVCSMSATASAAENNLPVYSAEEQRMYEELYAQDQLAIAEMMENLPRMIAEGQELAKHDAKANEPMLMANVLGSYGDIIVNTSLNIPSSSIGIPFIGHAAIVSNIARTTIESWPKVNSPIGVDGVQKYDNNWANISKSKLLRPVGANISQYEQAATYAENQVGKPYNWNFVNKKTTDSFYCSQLVWLAWLDAGIDCEAGSFPNAVIAPADLVNSKNTYIVQTVD